MKYFTTQVVLALLLTSVSSLEDSPWLSLNISSKELCSMSYGDFRVNIYEHFDNQNSTIIQGLRKYFYTPIALLSPQSAFSSFNNVTKQPEMRFRVETRNEKFESEVLHYLNNFVKKKRKQIKADQVQILPLDKVILTSTTPSTVYSLSREWLPYQNHKSLWFSLTCFEQKDCDKLALDMRANPDKFENFQLHFGLSSQSYKTKGVAMEMNITSSGKMASTLLKRTDRDEILLAAKDERRLFTEMTNNLIAESFEMEELVSSGSELQIYNMLRDMLGTSRLTIESPSDKLWKSVFWNNSNYRPDKTSKKLNKIYSDQNKKNQESLAKAYSNDESFKVEFGGFNMNKEFLDKEHPTARQFMEKLYDESKDYIVWDYEKFVTKPLSLVTVDLAQLREENSPKASTNDSFDEDRGVRVRYTTAALSIPLSFSQQADLTITNECANLRISTDENEGNNNVKNQ